MRTWLKHEAALAAAIAGRFANLDATRSLILATCHRCERRNTRIAAFCETVLALTARGDVDIAVPLHPSPQLARELQRRLSAHRHVHLIAPPDYAGCVYLLQRSSLALSDSGGLQEEATVLGKPVLVLRETTERLEAVWAGAAQIAGLSAARASGAATALLDDSVRYRALARPRAVFGDGRPPPRNRGCWQTRAAFKASCPDGNRRQRIVFWGSFGSAWLRSPVSLP